jgi:hypothetical protein
MEAAGLAPARHPAVEALVARNRIDRKREDARALLAEMRSLDRIERPVAPIAADRLSRSVFLEELRRRVAAGRPADG